jgi:hypothetical protein
MIGAAAGGILGGAGGAALGTVELPLVGTVAGAGAGALLGAEAGAGAGGIVGRGIQGGLDTVFGRPDALRNPRSAGTEASRQMLFETSGRALGGILERIAPSLRGTVAPKTPEAVERAGTNKEFGLGLSTGTITDNPRAQRLEYLAQRGMGGYGIQKAAQAKTDAAAEKAVGGILDSLGPRGTSTAAGEVAQDAITDAATRGARRVEGAVATNLAPRTGMGTTGELGAEGTQAARTSFARQQDAFNKLIAEAPPVDMTDMHAEAWRVLRDEIMPKLIENPSLGPKTKEWQNVVRLYRKASESGGQFALSPTTLKALEDAALEKAPYGPLRVVNQVLATPNAMSFSGALGLRSTLRDAGKGEELLAGDAAEALATYFETGSRTSPFRGIRGVLGDTYAPYEAAAEAYRTNRNLFKSAFVEKMAEANPEAVLATLTGNEGRFNASRIRQMSQVLQDLPKTWGSDEEIAAGKQAWDTIRAEWFRREIAQDNVFGMAERMKRVDPDVLRAWFPDLAGQNVLKQATVTANAFESKLMANLAEADPSKIVDMIGSSANHVREFQSRIQGLPGPVRKDELISRVRRAWTDANLVNGDPAKISERLAKADPDVLDAWYPKPIEIPEKATPDVVAKLDAENARRAQNREALDGLRRIGEALKPRQSVARGFGSYEIMQGASAATALMRGNLLAAVGAALGFEAVPAFISWAMYNPAVQRYLMDASGSATGTTLSKTAAYLRAIGAYRAATQTPAPVGAR